MLVRRAAASILKSNSRIASVHRLALPRPIFTFPARAVRNFGSTSTLSNTSNSTNSPFSKHSINMGGKGVLIAVKPDGTPHSSSSSNEALSSLGLEASALSALWKTSNAKPRPAEVRLFYGQGSSKDTTVALVGVGKVDGLNKDALLERTRTVAATGVKALREVGCTEVSRRYILASQVIQYACEYTTLMHSKSSLYPSILPSTLHIFIMPTCIIT